LTVPDPPQCGHLPGFDLSAVWFVVFIVSTPQKKGPIAKTLPPRRPAPAWAGAQHNAPL